MLTVTLRKLERDGIVQRSVFAEVPPRVQYELTELGMTLIAPVTGLADWSIMNRDALENNQRTFDERANKTRIRSAS
jgi:DNA-binding HxlR family transcriptional regulator